MPSIQLKIKNKTHLKFSAPVPSRTLKPLLCMCTAALTSSLPRNIKIHVHNKFKSLAAATAETIMQRLCNLNVKQVTKSLKS